MSDNNKIEFLSPIQIVPKYEKPKLIRNQQQEELANEELLKAKRHEEDEFYSQLLGHNGSSIDSLII